MKNLIILGAIPLILILVGAQTAKADLTPGDAAARNDFSQGNGFHPSCTDHGYDATQDPGFCLSFKTDYIAQWAILVLAH